MAQIIHCSIVDILCFAAVVKQLPCWLIGELLQKMSQLIQSDLLYQVGLCVPRRGSTTLYRPLIVVHTAVGIPHVVRDVDTLHIVFDNPVVCRGDGTNKHIGLSALVFEKSSELGLVVLPGILIQLGVLRNHIGQGESGIAAGHCKRVMKSCSKAAQCSREGSRYERNTSCVSLIPQRFIIY